MRFIITANLNGKTVYSQVEDLDYFIKASLDTFMWVQNEIPVHWNEGDRVLCTKADLDFISIKVDNH